jgi:hypothetical protein
LPVIIEPAKTSVAAASTTADAPLSTQELLNTQLAATIKDLAAAKIELATAKQNEVNVRNESNAIKNAANSAAKTAADKLAEKQLRFDEQAKKLQSEETRNNQLTMLYISHSILLSMNSAANGLFAAGTFGNVETLFNHNSSVWVNDDLRNGWDKLAQYTRFIGPALTVGGYYLTKTKADAGLTNALIATGSISFVFGEGGKAIGGHNEKDFFRTLTNVNTPDAKGPDGKVASTKYQTIMEHVALSRVAYDQIQLRSKVYESNRLKAQKVLEELLPLIEQANALNTALLQRKGDIDFKANSELAGKVLALTTRYGDAITANNYAVRDLRATYDYLQQYFPSAKERFAAEIVLLDNFLVKYEQLVERPVVSRLPEAQRQLSRWRELNDEFAEKQALASRQ